MAKPKHTKKNKVTPKCHCEYNHSIYEMFEESFDDKLDDSNAGEEYFNALSHSDKFGSMVSATEDEEMCSAMVLSDAVRIGFEAGKRWSEIKSLEKMVGI